MPNVYKRLLFDPFMAGLKNLKNLKSKEVKEIRNIVKAQWDAELPEGIFFLNTKENKLFFTNHEITKINFNSFNINTIGLYLGELQESQFRPSIEGAQLIGKDAKKNVVDLNDDETIQYLRGVDLEKDIENTGYIILRHGKDILGCGRKKEGKILNFYPKVRRLP